MDIRRICLVILLCRFLHLSASHHDFNLKNYIIQVQQQPKGIIRDWRGFYSSLLSSFIPEQDFPSERLIYDYHNIMNGFSAKLSEHEVDTMSKMSWFLHAYPDRMYSLETTHSPMFLGLQDSVSHGPGLWNTSNMGEGIIIAIIDTGIDITHPSFGDTGMSPPTPKWKGRCDFNMKSICNNKVIGARSFGELMENGTNIYDSPNDMVSHGTGTASVAAGNFVKDASYNGGSKGVAVGVAPRAHIAVYKVTKDDMIRSINALAAIDAAVADGVDVISLSFGVDDVVSKDFSDDAVAIGAFGAIKKGIFVSAAAGNSGRTSGQLINDVPWLLTVGASSIDRANMATVKLGDGQELDGESFYQPSRFKIDNMLPLVYFGNSTRSSLCYDDAISESEVRGKIVVCDGAEEPRRIHGEVQSDFIKRAGGAGIIIINSKMDGYNTDEDKTFPLLASVVPYEYGLKIKAYIKSTANATAKIVFKGLITGIPRSPIVGSFSSRGPSLKSPGILKPDIIGPGVGILTAFPTSMASMATQEGEKISPFVIQSGTSMSCPHLSGVAAIVKKEHPDWSPAAIKSAMMTTAYVKDLSGKPIVDGRLFPANYFTMGAGHVDPHRAINPGLVYDITTDDYIAYLCGLYNNDTKVGIIVRSPIQCSTRKSNLEGDLNLPSMVVFLRSDNTDVSSAVCYNREVINVGKAISTYQAEVSMHKDISITVNPRILQFTKLNEKAKFTICFKRTSISENNAVEGHLMWISSEYTVRSPLSIMFK